MKSAIALRSLAFALAALPLSGGLSAATARPTVEVAFVLDTTGSMGGLIEGAKRKIWSIATAIVDSNPDADIRMGLVAYRDIGDDYVTRKIDLTTDIQDLYAHLLELKARAQTSGAIRALLDLSPKTARLAAADGTEKDISLEQVKPGDHLRVRPGEKVPVDGVVLEGGPQFGPKVWFVRLGIDATLAAPWLP